MVSASGAFGLVVGYHLFLHDAGRRGADDLQSDRENMARRCGRGHTFKRTDAHLL